ncbi:MAG: histidine phosphatase family protein [bacterium]
MDAAIVSSPARTMAGVEGVEGTVHVIRHGEVYNPQKVLYGRLPGFHLSERGVEQARWIADLLGDGGIVSLVSSPLERALETAAPLAEATGLAVAPDERLIEAGNRLEGQLVAGGGRHLLRPANLYLFRNPMRPSWGEPYTQIALRMLDAVTDAVRAAEGQPAVCVTHQLPVVVLRRLVEGRRLWHDPRSRQCALASVTTLTFSEGTVAVEYREPAGSPSPGAVAGA